MFLKEKSGWFLPEKRIINDFLNIGLERVFKIINNLLDKDLVDIILKINLKISLNANNYSFDVTNLVQ